MVLSFSDLCHTHLCVGCSKLPPDEQAKLEEEERQMRLWCGLADAARSTGNCDCLGKADTDAGENEGHGGDGALASLKDELAGVDLTALKKLVTMKGTCLRSMCLPCSHVRGGVHSSLRFGQGVRKGSRG